MLTSKSADELSFPFAVFKKRGSKWELVCQVSGRSEKWSFKSKAAAKRFLRQLEDGQVQGHRGIADYKLMERTWVESYFHAPYPKLTEHDSSHQHT